jgi:hypothetical protein
LLGGESGIAMVGPDKLRIQAERLFAFALRTQKTGNAVDAAALAARAAQYLNEAERLEHDPEKWEPVFGKDHAQTKG